MPDSPTLSALTTPLAAWMLLALFLGAAACLASALALARRKTSLAPPEGEAQASPGRPPPLLAARPAGQKQAPLQRQLAQAGFDHPQAAAWFMQIKWLCAGLGAGAGLGLLALMPPREHGIQIAVAATGFLLGFLLPTWVIDRRRRGFRSRIALALPDALDFMLISVEAGQSIDMALLRVATELDEIHPEMAARFHALVEALSAGASRQDAFLRLAQETENEDLRQFATIVVQAVEMGTPVVQTLRVFTADLRDRRIRRVEERANLLPTKMTLGTMVFTVPPLLILLLAPAVYRITTAF